MSTKVSTGQRFGRWTVLVESDNSRSDRRTYRCRCDCGTERDVLGSSLYKNKSTSCGCYRREVLEARPTIKTKMIGKQFGKIVVLSQSENRTKNGDIRVNVRCDCGAEFEEIGYKVRYGKVTSCTDCAARPESKGIVDMSCKGCRYRMRISSPELEYYCNYIVATGVRRGCPAGVGCNRKDIKK